MALSMALGRGKNTFCPISLTKGTRFTHSTGEGMEKSAGRERLRWNRITDYVEDVTEVASSLKQPPIIVGHSMGGYVVQKYLEHHHAPCGILLASAPPGGTKKTTVKTALQNPGKLLKTLITGRVNLYNNEAGAVQAFFLGQYAAGTAQAIRQQFAGRVAPGLFWRWLECRCRHRKSRLPCWFSVQRTTSS